MFKSLKNELQLKCILGFCMSVCVCVCVIIQDFMLLYYITFHTYFSKI